MYISDNKINNPYYSMWLSLDEEKFDVDFSDTKKKYWLAYRMVMDAPKEMNIIKERDKFNELLDFVDALYDEVSKEERQGF